LVLVTPEEMIRDLEGERRKRRLATIAETARVIIGEYLAKKDQELGQR
jgi:hypothetical protein